MYMYVCVYIYIYIMLYTHAHEDAYIYDIWVCVIYMYNSTHFLYCTSCIHIMLQTHRNRPRVRDITTNT